jgi:uncharacterized membrane protein YdjX (TVP38/TMEM64 family)
MQAVGESTLRGTTVELPKRYLLVGMTGVVIIAVFLSCTFLLCSIIEGASWCIWWPHITPSDAVEIVRSSGFWGVGISIGFMVIHSFVPFPAEMVAIANGMAYGMFWGIVVTWVGAMLGAFLSFGLARKFGRGLIYRILSERRSRQLDDWVAKHGGGALFVSRLTPVIAFNLINYAAGLTGVSWWTFTWTTGLGILPMTVFMVAMGDQGTRLLWFLWIPIIGVAVLVWIVLHLLSRRRRIMRR